MITTVCLIELSIKTIAPLHKFIHNLFANFRFPGPQDIHYVYCLFFVTFVPLRWIYYRFKKWHYYLLVSSSSIISHNL